MNVSTATSLDVASAERLFESWIGFDIHGAAPRRLREFLGMRAAQLGFDTVFRYLEALPADRPTSLEAQRLVNVLTNGMTAFWRDRHQLEALGVILRQLYDRYERPLDVWCAGCATGEEAYSIAIAARELGVPVRVLGTDVNTTYLDDARRATFDDWSLRRLDDAYRDRWFVRRGEHWAVDRQIAGDVEFRHHNLLDLPPIPVNGVWDVILCRNVVIYLTEEAVTRILFRFAGSLAPDGYLLLGSSEEIGSRFPGFRAVRKGPAFVYRPVELAPGQSVPFPSMDLEPEFEGLDEQTAGFADDDAVGKLINAAQEHPHDGAIACYEAASCYDPFVPEVYSLLSLAMIEVGATERAVRALGKVLFLDPDNWWAAIRLAELHEGRDERVEAIRHYRAALESMAVREDQPFDPNLSVGPLAGVADTIELERERAARALDRLVGRGDF